MQLKSCNIFWNEMQGRVLKKGEITQSNLPFLCDIILVDGLTVILTNINQRCVQDFQVNFSKNNCLVVMIGNRLFDNCYRKLLIQVKYLVLYQRMMRLRCGTNVWDIWICAQSKNLFLRKPNLEYHLCMLKLTVFVVNVRLANNESRHLIKELVIAMLIEFWSNFVWIWWSQCKLKAYVVKDMCLSMLMTFQSLLGFDL